MSFGGGGKDNAIPRGAEAVLLSCDAPSVAALCEALKAAAQALRAEPQIILSDKDFSFSAEDMGAVAATPVMDAESTCRVLDTLALARDGVLAMSAHKAGLVAYSRNLGVASTVCDGAGNPVAVRLAFSTR